VLAGSLITLYLLLQAQAWLLAHAGKGSCRLQPLLYVPNGFTGT
jgi:hypothetical protein